MIRKLIIHWLLGLDALVRYIGIGIAFTILGYALNFIASAAAKVLLGSPEPGWVHGVFLFIGLPIIARLAMATGSASPFPLRKKAAETEPTAQAGPPPSRQSLPSSQ